MVVVIEDKEILPYEIGNIMAHIRIDSTKGGETSKNYLVDTNSTFLED